MSYLTAPSPEAQTVQSWALSTNDPRRFVTEVLGADIEPWQAEALDLIQRNDRVAIRAGHGVGKTAFLAWVLLWFMLTRLDYKVPVTANSQDQLRDVVWPEIAKWARRLPAGLADRLEITAERIELKGREDCFAVARTASKDRPEALQGFHADRLLFLIEEASGIPDQVFEVALGALSTPGAKVLMIGNPTRLSGFFHDAFHRMRDRWVTMRVNSEDVPRARGHIADILKRYGRDSNAYRVRVLGEFPTTEDEQVVPLEWVEQAVDRDVDPIQEWAPVWGLDVARFGNDRTALAKRRANVLLEPVKVWQQMDTMQVAGAVAMEFAKTAPVNRPAEIMVDVIGIGAGVYDRLREQGLPVRAVNVGESPASGKDRYMRLRDELWFRAREWFQGRACRIPDDSDLIAELTAPLYSFTSSGKVLVESKDEMRARGMRSPDIADAFILTMAGGLHPAGDQEWDGDDDYNMSDRSGVTGY